eukprot:549844-Amorphochlora_amoeboformis.AAC.2
MKLKKQKAQQNPGAKKEESKKAATAYMRMQADMSVLELPPYVKLNQDDVKVGEYMLGLTLKNFSHFKVTFDTKFVRAG